VSHDNFSAKEFRKEMGPITNLAQSLNAEIFESLLSLDYGYEQDQHSTTANFETNFSLQLRSPLLRGLKSMRSHRQPSVVLD
jgi:hypothetical protein